MRCRMRERQVSSFAHGVPAPVARRVLEPITGSIAQVFAAAKCRVSLEASPAWLRGPQAAQQIRLASNLRGVAMNNIVWLVGAVVIVLFVLGYLGLR
ncbi:hypothetical protein C6Q13_02980 [Burkholderia gladioli]|nr:hypothetical protein C6Q13_02980 [Burkholderia gladioli]